MALVANEDLRDGWMLIARAGTVVSPEMVDKHGWHDKVHQTRDAPAKTPAAPKATPRKKATTPRARKKKT